MHSLMIKQAVFQVNTSEVMISGDGSLPATNSAYRTCCRGRNDDMAVVIATVSKKHFEKKIIV